MSGENNEVRKKDSGRQTKISGVPFFTSIGVPFLHIAIFSCSRLITSPFWPSDFTSKLCKLNYGSQHQLEAFTIASEAINQKFSAVNTAGDCVMDSMRPGMGCLLAASNRPSGKNVPVSFVVGLPVRFGTGKDRRVAMKT
jgi:hypothetical protein